MLIFLFVISFFQNSHAVENSQILEWASERQWLNMGHYKKNLFGWESQVDAPGFFLAADGKKNQLSELQATVEAFRRNDIDVICRFPARYLWLKSKLAGLDVDLRTSCPVYGEFVEKVSARSVSLIFSSYFVNTPASAFGHTFLRLNRTLHRDDNSDQAELLDYGVNFAAQSDGSGAFLYAMKGLLGLYPGVFTSIPYYYKVREYNDYESRDLWEYKLKFTQLQIDLIVAHVWELAPLYIDYLYFTENCAYHILALLEVGNPELELTSQLPPLYVIPVDTVRAAVNLPGFVVGKKYRPSVLSRLEERSLKLTSEQVKMARDVAEKPQSTDSIIKSSFSEEQKAEILETSINGFDFINSEGLIFHPKKTNAERHKLLLARSEVDIVSATNEIQPAVQNWPENGHSSQRFGVMAGYRHNAGAFTSAHMRFALHDLLDPLPGQPTFSQLSFGDIEGRFQQTDYSRLNKFYLEKFDIFRVSSFQPITNWQKATSWDGRIGVKKINDGECDQCFAYSAEAGAGGTIAQRESESFVALLNKFHFDYSDGFIKPVRLAVGPEVWARWVPNFRWSSMLILGYKWSNYLEQPLFAEQIFTHSLEVRYHANKQWSYALKGVGHEDHGREVQLGFNRFF